MVKSEKEYLQEQKKTRIYLVMAPSMKFMQCLQFAAHKHRDQRRKDVKQTPYINHPINVATILAQEAGISDETVLMAALLHDVVEDTDATFQEVERLFGEEICSIVREVTDDKSLEKQVRKKKQVENAVHLTYNAKLVQLADKLDNLRDLQIALPVGWTEELRDQYFIWAQKVVSNLRGTNTCLETCLDDIFKTHKLLH